MSGLVLQRQSVKNLNAVLHPSGGRKGPWEKLVQRAEFALEANNPTIATQLEFALDDERDGKDTRQRSGSVDDPTEVNIPTQPDWSRRVYVQMVKTSDEICDAMVGITSLSRQGSKARRLLVYPSEWDDEITRGTMPELELISIAKQEHLLETLTTGQVVYQDDNLVDSLLNQDFDKMLYLPPQGLIINATHLDDVFNTKMTEETITIQQDDELAAILVQPRQAHSNKYEDVLGSPQRSFDGMVETLPHIQLSRSLANLYRQGQLLGDIGYLRYQKDAPLDHPIHDELRKRRSNNFVDLILEQVRTDQEGVCGALAPGFVVL